MSLRLLFLIGCGSVFRIAFNQEPALVFCPDRTGDPEIFMQIPGKDEPVNLTKNPSKKNCPAVSPDGRKIAFLSDRTGIENIFVMDNDGRNVKQITRSDVSLEHPYWSPDGEKIFFVKAFSVP